MTRSARLRPKFDTSEEVPVRAPALTTQLDWNGATPTSLSHFGTLDVDLSQRRLTFVLSIRR